MGSTVSIEQWLSKRTSPISRMYEREEAEIRYIYTGRDYNHVGCQNRSSGIVTCKYVCGEVYSQDRGIDSFKYVKLLPYLCILPKRAKLSTYPVSNLLK